MMIRLLLLLLSFSALAAGPRVYGPPGGFQDNFWQNVQLQNLQTQQQLQYQDQYRRQLLLQDQQHQIQQLIDQQNQLEYMQRNLNMHEYSDRLKMYSKQPNAIKEKKK